MANYLCIFPAPDSHIRFIVENPETLFDYVSGNRPTIATPPTIKPTIWQRLTGKIPQQEPPPEVPADWPASEVTMLGPEVNHRNVDLYHLILNGTENFVAGGGSIFQSWLETPSDRTHSAIDLTGDNEHFAFYAERLPALYDLLLGVDAEKVAVRFTQWLRSKGDDYTPSEEECSEIAQEFTEFAENTREAISRSHGFIWVCS